MVYFRGQGRRKIRKIVEKDLTKGCNNQELNAFEELAKSHFGLVMRGDNMFSYRFSEVMVMGVVPVVIGTGET